MKYLLLQVGGTLAAAFIMALAGCVQRPSEDEYGTPTDTFTMLAVNKWANGNIVSSNSGATVKFVATDTNLYIWIKHSTLYGARIYLYASDMNPIGDGVAKKGNPSEMNNFSKSVEIDKPYYIKVVGQYYDWAWKNSYGTYWIGFTDFPAQPETAITPLDENTWTNGNVMYPNCDQTAEQWFRFTATATTQHIWIKHSTLYGARFYLYDIDLNPIGDEVSKTGNASVVNSFSKSVEIDKPYYIKVVGQYYDWGWKNSYGTYWIAFNSTSTEPAQ